ncbi:putative Ribulose-phosphate 3-epimerase [Actinacidiphila bryophytorum]|uniref:Ribulose-phosphate 3-epimerase n=1 Tax=Actinacidiphila bryophytorum TaxID=1436133 RepID=A0A9W4MJQ7_9ACTN|nr:putative Ribulose-phosphate 3-epimerase [Actinacidiphila bryophytorum]
MPFRGRGRELHPQGAGVHADRARTPSRQGPDPGGRLHPHHRRPLDPVRVPTPPPLTAVGLGGACHLRWALAFPPVAGWARSSPRPWSLPSVRRAGVFRRRPLRTEGERFSGARGTARPAHRRGEVPGPAGKGSAGGRGDWADAPEFTYERRTAESNRLAARWLRLHPDRPVRDSDPAGRRHRGLGRRGVRRGLLRRRRG